MGYLFKTDLLRQVVNVLPEENGGNGSEYGEGRVVLHGLNSTGSNLPLYGVVKWKFGSNDNRVELASASDGRVLGVVRGYYTGGGFLVESNAPTGYEVAVQTAGESPVLIQSNIIRGQYAKVSSTDGKIYSTTTAAGAFGQARTTAYSGQGHTTAVVSFPILSSGIGGGSSGWDDVILKSADEDVASSTVLQNDNELFTPTLVSNGFYEFEAVIFMANPGAGSAPDLKFSWGEDNTFRGYYFRIGGNATTGTAEIILGSVQQNQTVSVQTGTTPFGIYCRGSWTSGGGVFRLQWAQLASNVNPTRVYAGSVLRYSRIA